MAIETPPDALPCGRDPVEVLDRARTGRTDQHSSTCPYCLAIIGADEPARLVARNVRAEPVQVPDTLLPAVMRTVWSELRPGREIPLPAGHGAAFATEQAVTSMVEHDLDLLDDLMVHLCTLEFSADSDDEPGDDEQPVAPPGIRLEVRAAAAYSADIPELAALVRAQAATTLLAQFGLIAASIDIHFVDVYEFGSSTV